MGFKGFWKRRNKKNRKIINTGKKEVKLLTDDMTVYVKNLNKSTKKLLELLNEFSKFIGQRFNIKNKLLQLISDAAYFV